MGSLQYEIEESLTEYIVKFYALLTLHNFYEKVYDTRNKLLLKKFDLRYEIQFFIFWNGQLHNKYILAYKQLKHSIFIDDFSIQIGQRIYILRSDEKFVRIKENSKALKKEKKTVSHEEPVDFYKLFNTIEFHERGIVKFPTPILYTGMTD